MPTLVVHTRDSRQQRANGTTARVRTPSPVGAVCEERARNADVLQPEQGTLIEPSS